MEEKLENNPFEHLSKAALEIILSEIIALRLKPGMKLNISKLSEELNLSRTPVREALNKLCETGFVYKFDNKQGYYVYEFKISDMEQVFAARSMIECKASYLCAQMKKCPDIDKLKRLADTDYKINYSNFELTVEKDYELHKLIVISCGNKYLLNFYENIENKIKLYKKIILHNLLNNYEPELEKLATQHKAIINSIIFNMPELAEKEMFNHINESFSALAYSYKDLY